MPTGMFRTRNVRPPGRESRPIGASALELTSHAANGIEGALLGVEARGYGTCLDCASWISSARLRALPFADRCRGCQEARDLVASLRESSWRGVPA